MTRPKAGVQVGCCGFALAQAKYFPAFPAVEINSSFYNLPQLETAAKWKAAAPPGFEFALKAWQVITHPGSSPTYKRTRLDERDRGHCGYFGFNPTVRWAWERTFEVATTLDAVLVLFQCPAGFTPTREHIKRIEQFFTRAKRGKFQLGWEPRGQWDPKLIGSLCRELDLVHVTDPFVLPPVTTRPFRYYRLHGIGSTAHRYTPTELELLQNFCAGKEPVYCFFNNVAMATDASRFQRLIASSRD